LSIYRITDTKIEELEKTTFAAEKVKERQDLQRLIRNDVTILGTDLKVVAEEFSNWEDSNRRIDLLCIDSEAQLVVVELKRSEDGGHMDLQAIRYAAMVSSMTFEQVVEVYAKRLTDEQPRAKAREEILDFLGWESEAETFNREVRIILVSAEFSVEITTAVLWLNKKGLDITCIRLKPYRLGSEILIDVQQIVPLPEAADYEIKNRAQEQENKRISAAIESNWSGLWYANVDEGESRSWEDMRQYGFIAAGGGPRWIGPLRKLKPGDEVYMYQKGQGYVGHGVVLSEPVPVKDFTVDGTPIRQLTIRQPGLLHDLEDLKITEWIAPMRWTETVPISDAKTFKGIFANQASVCRLRQLETIKFLKASFSA
jgi:hypothetical protein